MAMDSGQSIKMVRLKEGVRRIFVSHCDVLLMGTGTARTAAVPGARYLYLIYYFDTRDERVSTMPPNSVFLTVGDPCFGYRSPRFEPERLGKCCKYLSSCISLFAPS